MENTFEGRVYNRICNIIGGDITKWPTFVIQYVFCEVPDWEHYGDRLAVASFFYGNRVPINWLIVFLQNANIRWMERSLMFMRYWYLRFEHYGAERKKRTYYNVRQKKVLSLYYNTLAHFDRENRNAGYYPWGYFITLNNGIGPDYLDPECNEIVHMVLSLWRGGRPRIVARRLFVDPDEPVAGPSTEPEPVFDGRNNDSRDTRDLLELSAQNDRSRSATDPDLAFLLADVFSVPYKDL